MATSSVQTPARRPAPTIRSVGRPGADDGRNDRRAGALFSYAAAGVALAGAVLAFAAALF